MLLTFLKTKHRRGLKVVARANTIYSFEHLKQFRQEGCQEGYFSYFSSNDWDIIFIYYKNLKDK